MTNLKADKTVNRIITCLNKMNLGTEQKLLPDLTALAAGIKTEEDLTSNILNNAELTKKEKAAVCFKVFLNKLDPFYVYKAGNLSTEYQFIAWVVSSLVKEDFDYAGIRARLGHKWDMDLIHTFFTHLELTEQDLELFGDLIPQAKITEFYQVQKSNKQETHLNEATNNINGWYKNYAGINYDQTTEIGQFMGGNLYGYLAPKFDTGIWQKALNCGFAKRASGVDGIKFLEHKVLELKINGDTRLYTNVVYKNDLGDFLAIFDNEANHSGIKRVVNSVKKNIYVEEGYEAVSPSHYEVLGDMNVDLAGDMPPMIETTC